MGNINVVLYEPEIPQNTGNIMRTCLATNSILHLIEPLGFKLDEKSIKRSGVNLVDDVKYFVYKNWDEFLEKNNIKDFSNVYFFSRYGLKSPYDFNVSDVNKDYYFVLGKESTGIPKEILKEHLETCIRLPMNEKVRALNLSNTVAIVVYEALRQQNFRDLSWYEPENFKGKDYLLK